METPFSEVSQVPQPAVTPNIYNPSRLECLGGVIVSPIKTFEYLATKPQWLLPLIILALWVLLGYVLKSAMLVGTMFPAMIGQMGGGDTSAQVPVYANVLVGIFFGAIEWLFGAIGTVAVFLAMAGILYLLTMAFRAKPYFYPLAATLAYAEFVPRLARASVREVIPLFTGNFSLIRPTLPTGILEIFGKTDFPSLLQPLLGRVELFHIWSFALVAISLKFTAGVTKKKAVLITALYWVVCILAVTGVTAFGEFLSTILTSVR